jgi:hypothetical protein
MNAFKREKQRKTCLRAGERENHMKTEAETVMM